MPARLTLNNAAIAPRPMVNRGGRICPTAKQAMGRTSGIGNRESGIESQNPREATLALRGLPRVLTFDSRFPIPDSRLQACQQRVVVRRVRDALDQPLHRR